MADTNIVILLFENVTQLDVTGPFEVLSRIPSVNVELVAKSLAPVVSDAGLRICPSATFETCESKPSLFLIPGGYGIMEAIDDTSTFSFCQKMTTKSEVVASVCTGALFLAVLGLLKGIEATSHWSVSSLLSMAGAVPVSKRITNQGRIWTSAGVSAGIDMALKLAERFAGSEAAQIIQLNIEYSPEPPFNSGTLQSAPGVVRDRAVNAYAERTQQRKRHFAQILGRYANQSGDVAGVTN